MVDNLKLTWCKEMLATAVLPDFKSVVLSGLWKLGESGSSHSLVISVIMIVCGIMGFVEL